MKKICVITGATGGIGWHLCEGFASKGYEVVAIDRELQRPLSEGIHFYTVDFESEEAIRTAFADIKTRFGAVHVLVNNAAMSTFSKPLTEITTEEFDLVLRINLRGAFVCSQAFIHCNESESYGRIINIASTRWSQNEANWEAYGASKGGLVALTNSMAISLSNTPITVNAISPGWIQTSNYEDLTTSDHNQHPSGRVGKPRDIVNAALFLADEENDFINAANIVVDGGMTKKMIYV